MRLQERMYIDSIVNDGTPVLFVELAQSSQWRRQTYKSRS